MLRNLINLLCLCGATGSCLVGHAFCLHKGSCPSLPLLDQDLCISHLGVFLTITLTYTLTGKHQEFYNFTKTWNVATGIATPNNSHFRLEFPLSNLLLFLGSKLDSLNLFILANILKIATSTSSPRAATTPPHPAQNLQLKLSDYCAALRHVWRPGPGWQISHQTLSLTIPEPRVS